MWGICGVCTLALTVAKTAPATIAPARSLLLFDLAEQDGNISGPKGPQGTRGNRDFRGNLAFFAGIEWNAIEFYRICCMARSLRSLRQVATLRHGHMARRSASLRSCIQGTKGLREISSIY